MADLKAKVQLGLNNKLSGGIKTAGRDMASFASGASGALSRVDRAISGTAGKLLSLGGGLGLAAAAKQTIDLEKQMTRLGTQAGVSAAEMDKLKANIFAVSRNNKIKVDPSQLLGAVDSIIERTGDMDFARENLESIAMAIQASGAEGNAIGGLYAEFQKMGLGADTAMQAIDTLTLQGKNGAFTLENLAALGPRVINAYTATGRNGAAALTEMGAALQVIRRGTGSSEQAATSFEALMRNLVDPTKQKKLKDMGVSVYDTAGKFRSVTSLIEEIVTKSKGDLSSLGTIFDSEAMRAFNSAISEFQRSGTVGSLEEFLKMQGDGSTVMKDSARNASTMAANLTNLKTSFQDFADDNLAAPIEKVANVLNSVSPEQFDTWMNGAKNVAIGLAALKGVTMTASALTSVAGLVKAVPGRSGAASMASGMGGGSPVFVTNWPAGMGGITGGAGASASGVVASGGARSTAAILKATARQGGIRGAVARGLFKPFVRLSAAAGRSGALGSVLRMGGRIASKANVAIPVALSAVEIAKIAGSRNLNKEEKTKEISGAAGGLGGILAGAAAGAALGSVIPGAGTAVGALLGIGGSLLGGYLGRKGGEKIGDGINSISSMANNSASGMNIPTATSYMPGAPGVNIRNEMNIEELAEGYAYRNNTYINDMLVNVETGAQSRSIQG